MLKGKDIFTFVRFGGLDLKNQNGFSQTPETYHQPPASRGFYAMPKIAQELFLVGSLSSTQPGIFAKKSEDPNYWKNKLRQIRKEFRKTDGEIWHHLEEYTNHIDAWFASCDEEEIKQKKLLADLNSLQGTNKKNEEDIQKLEAKKKAGRAIWPLRCP